MAYGLGRGRADEEPVIVVFDLGGGTFDVCLLQSFDGILEVVASDGDNALGGIDVDHAIARTMLQRAAAGDGAAHNAPHNAPLLEKLPRVLSYKANAPCQVLVECVAARLDQRTVHGKLGQPAAAQVQGRLNGRTWTALPGFRCFTRRVLARKLCPPATNGVSLYQPCAGMGQARSKRGRQVTLTPPQRLCSGGCGSPCGD